MERFIFTLSDGEELPITAPDEKTAKEIAEQLINAKPFVEDTTAAEEGADTVLGASVPEDPRGEIIANEAIDAVLLGGLDEARAYFGTLAETILGDQYGNYPNFTNQRAQDRLQQLEVQRTADRERFADEAINPATVGQLSGALYSAPIAGGIVGGLTKGMGLGARVAGGAAGGATYGGTAGFLTEQGSVEERKRSAAIGGLIGAPLGILGNLFVNKGGRAVNQDIDMVKDYATGLYEKIGDLNFVINKPAAQRLQKSLRDIYSPKSPLLGRVDPTYSKTVDKDAVDALLEAHDRINYAIRPAHRVQGMTVNQLLVMRRTFRAVNVNPKASPNARRMADVAVDKVDEFLSELSEHKDVIAIPGTKGNADLMRPLLKDARTAWSAYKRADELARAIYRAQMKGEVTNFSSAIKNEFNRLAIKIKEGRLKGFSKEELQAIEDVVKSGKLVGFFDRIGRLAPSSGGGQFAALVGLSQFGPKALLGSAGAAIGRGGSNVMRRGLAERAINQVLPKGFEPGKTPRIGNAVRRGAALAPAQLGITEERRRELGESGLARYLSQFQQ